MKQSDVFEYNYKETYRPVFHFSLSYGRLCFLQQRGSMHNNEPENI